MPSPEDTPFREISLSSTRYPGMVALVDEADYEELSAFAWSPARRKTSRGNVTWYAQRGGLVPCKPGTIILMHRQILRAPIGVLVDHRDGVGLNCRRWNLRLATRSQNCQNQQHPRVRNGVRFKGITPNGSGWMANVGSHGKRFYLGNFRTPEDAARAYDRAALLHLGEFAATNESLGLLPHLQA